MSHPPPSSSSLTPQLPANVDLDTFTLEAALPLLSLPLTLGADAEGESVVVNRGPFGPYVLHRGTFVSIPKDRDMFSLTLDEAIELYKAKLARGPGRGRGKGAVPTEAAEAEAGASKEEDAAAAKKGRKASSTASFSSSAAPAKKSSSITARKAAAAGKEKEGKGAAAPKVKITRAYSTAAEADAAGDKKSRLSAWSTYLKANLGQGATMKELSERWKGLTEEEKAKYGAAAAAAATGAAELSPV
jgi:DNA topoisomerase I